MFNSIFILTNFSWRNLSACPHLPGYVYDYFYREIFSTKDSKVSQKQKSHSVWSQNISNDPPSGSRRISLYQPLKIFIWARSSPNTNQLCTRRESWLECEAKISMRRFSKQKIWWLFEQFGVFRKLLRHWKIFLAQTNKPSRAR